MQENPMIIECDACRARFRLDRMLLQGYLGVRFRCRRCGGPIIVTVSESPIAQDPASPGYRHDLNGPSIPLSAPSAPPRPDRLAAVRTSPSAQPLFEEESVADAKPNNLIDLQSLRKAYRGRMLASTDNITRNITSEIPYLKPPFPVHPIPEPPIPVAEAPAHRIPRELPAPPAPRRNVRHSQKSVEPSRPVVIIAVAAIGTAMGCLALYFMLLGLILVLK
jgi:predicted Zn finger-like uncharacterized protein